MPTATISLPRASAAASAVATTLTPGARLGAYELLLPLASGGMGHVWSAVRIGDFGFRRAVAIKVMREELAADPEFRTMFLDEARLASRVSHGNVVEVLDLGEDRGILYQAMALVDGDSLARLQEAAKAKAAPLPFGVVARIVADVLRGLHAAHELRDDAGALLEFVHRDVSPHNILVGLDGIAKITDFGVAKAAGVARGVSRSGRKGKLAYMPVEQREGDAIDRRCDVFAAGVVLWELLVGRRRGEADAIPHPCDIDPNAHRPLGDVAMRALAHRREDRFTTAEEMADAVERAAHDSGQVLSSRSVAAWVSELASERILRRRQDTEAQLARTLGGTASPVEDAVPKPAARKWLLGGGALFTLALALGVGRWATTRPIEPLPAPAAAAAPPPSAVVAPPDAPPASAASTAASSGAASATHPKPVRRPKSAPAELPKYKNPY